MKKNRTPDALSRSITEETSRSRHEHTAGAAGPAPDLHYVDDSLPGISRRRLRGRFAYFDPGGERIRVETEIERIDRLAIPPAYIDVWICIDPLGHLQATGRDVRGRKQYRYHPRWTEVRDSAKYERLLRFGESLPALRRRIERDLALPGLGAEKVMATVVELLDRTLIRIGNERYRKENRSFGLTTLNNRHVEVQGTRIRFAFRGKSGIRHSVDIEHPRLARILRRCLELPGQQLFQYLDADHQRHMIDSRDINAYLREHAGEEFTAKDYRTWLAPPWPLSTAAGPTGKTRRAPTASSSRSSSRWPTNWATLRRSAANATCIRG